MSDIKNKVQGVDPNVRARDIKAMAEKTGNLYETISIISKRANQLNMEIKKELHFKLEEFAVSSDTIEEVHEPFLIMEGFIQRTPRGRTATEKAYKHIGAVPPRKEGTLF